MHVFLRIVLAAIFVAQLTLFDRAASAWGSPAASPPEATELQPLNLSAVETQWGGMKDQRSSLFGTYLCLDVDEPAGMDVLVGFRDQNGCAYLYQSRAQFDLSELAKHRVSSVRQAILEFDEKDISQNRVDGPTCVAAVNAATPDQPEQGLFHYYEDQFHQTGPNPRDWDVTDAVNKWFTNDWGNHGLVLRGFDETLNPDSNEAWCDSTLSNFTLKLIVEAEAPAAPPPPKPLPDLQIVSIEVHDAAGVTGCGAGDGNSVTVVVRNGGAAPTQPADLYLRTYGVERTLTAVVTAGPGQDQQLVFDHVPMQPGPLSVDALVDSKGAVDETNNQNNLMTILVTCATAPASLSVENMQIQSQGVAMTDSAGKPACLIGSSNSIRATVKNAGDVDPGLLDVQLLVDGNEGGKTSMGGVSPRSDKVTIVSPVSLKKGTHTLQLVLDPQGKAIKSSVLSVTCMNPPK